MTIVAATPLETPEASTSEEGEERVRKEEEGTRVSSYLRAQVHLVNDIIVCSEFAPAGACLGA